MSYSEEIWLLREKIDNLDNELLNILKQRFDVVQKIWEFKKENNIAPLDENRWQKIIYNIRKKSEEKNINPDFVENLWNTIHGEALKLEAIETVKTGED